MFTKKTEEEYLPKIAEVIALICRFKPLSSSATGLSAASASSTRFGKAAFSVSQHARSLLKLSSVVPWMLLILKAYEKVIYQRKRKS